MIAPMPDPPPQRRRFPRYQADLPATLYLESGVMQVRVKNLSRGGFFVSPPLLGLQSPQVKVSFQLEEGEPPINCKGEVLYTIADRGSGIVFTEISGHNLDRITASFERQEAAENT